MDFSSAVDDLSICIIPLWFSSPAVQEMQLPNETLGYIGHNLYNVSW